MSDTPRTDAQQWSGPKTEHAELRVFAKSLERELNAFVRLTLGDEATLTPSGNVVLAVAKLKEDLEELARLRAGGCARDQRTTQFCAEVVELERKLEAWQAYAGRLEDTGDLVTSWAPEKSRRAWKQARETKP